MWTVGGTTRTVHDTVCATTVHVRRVRPGNRESVSRRFVSSFASGARWRSGHVNACFVFNRYRPPSTPPSVVRLRVARPLALCLVPCPALRPFALWETRCNNVRKEIPSENSPVTFSPLLLDCPDSMRFFVLACCSTLVSSFSPGVASSPLRIAHRTSVSAPIVMRRGDPPVQEKEKTGLAALFGGGKEADGKVVPTKRDGEEEDESKKLLQQIKDAGAAGIIS